LRMMHNESTNDFNLPRFPTKRRPNLELVALFFTERISVAFNRTIVDTCTANKSHDGAPVVLPDVVYVARSKLALL